METELFNWLLDIPTTIAGFGSWLTTPLDVINISPLGLLGVAGVTTIIIIIAVHIVKLFI